MFFYKIIKEVFILKMKIVKISFKNLFAYGEKVNTIDYSQENKLILLSGVSGAGKSSILNLPILLLYGKIEKVPKNSIANRINRNGWIRGTIIKGQSVYEIERTFMPNSIKILKDGKDIENYGSRDAQGYIDQEIIEIPQTTFTNLISISMKKFKSFLVMSPYDRKQIIDRVFNLEIINVVFENIKKDSREIGDTINSDNSAINSLSITLKNTNNELNKLKDKLNVEDKQNEINDNLNKINQINSNIQKYLDAYKKVQDKFNEININLNNIKKEELTNEMNINNIKSKIDLFKQDKCPTCGISFTSEHFLEIKNKLNVLLETKIKIKEQQKDSLILLDNNKNKISEYLNQLSTEIYNMKTEISKLETSNTIIQNKMKASSEMKSVYNIINKTTEQIQELKSNIEINNKKMYELQNLQLIYSIDGVKQQVINNYLPLLNKEIAENLILLNFPYLLEFDSKFDPHLTDLGTIVPVETLSDGEMTRVDLIILCSLFKLLKRRYPSINIFSIDELLSSLDTINSKVLLKFLKEFIIDMKLNCMVVSHTDLNLEEFDEIIEISREKGFSQLNVVDQQNI